MARAAAGVADRTEFRVQDVLVADFSQASVVTVYLLPGLMAQLSPIFLDKLKAGSRIVTHAFVFPSWKPDRIEKIRLAVPHPSQGDESTIFLWVVPADARGAWRAPARDGDWRVKIDQNFQEVEVEGEAGNAKLAVAGAKLEGTQLRFSGTLRGAPYSFRGTVEKGRIAGEVELADGAPSLTSNLPSSPWCSPNESRRQAGRNAQRLRGPLGLRHPRQRRARDRARVRGGRHRIRAGQERALLRVHGRCRLPAHRKAHGADPGARGPASRTRCRASRVRCRSALRSRCCAARWPRSRWASTTTRCSTMSRWPGRSPSTPRR